MSLIGGYQSAFALDNSPEWSGISFDFTNPGARARGIGGAFVAVADDASAMVTNPAGLNNLERPQIVIEGKYFTTDTDDSTIIGWDNSAIIDRKDTNYADITYLSLSTPLPNKNFTMGLFYNENMHSESQLDIQYLFYGLPDYFTTFTVDTKLNVDQFGLALAGSLMEGKVKLGVTLSYLDLNIDSSFQALDFTSAAGDYTMKPYNLQNIGNGEYAIGFGILLQPIEKLTVGFNASIMPSFDVTSQITQGFWDDTYDPFTETNSFANGQDWDPDTFDHCTPGPDGRSYRCDSQFSMPDIYSIGAAYRPNDNWLFSVEGKFVKYSDLLDSFRAPYWYLEGSYAWEFDIDDVWEFHAGVEYLTFIKEKPLAFRFGIYSDPAHELKYTGSDTVTFGVFDGGEDQTHVTAGLGTLISDSFQLDLAIDYAEEASQLVISAGYRF